MSHSQQLKFNQNPIALIGNQCVMTEQKENEVDIFSLRIETGEEVWKETFSSKTALDLVSNEAGDLLAALEPSGKFKLIQLSTGKPLVRVTVISI
ncbi:MAG: hypothetical protein R3C11_12225 [Planctomycetaceae bacterium]